MATINNSRLPAMVQWPDYDRQRLKSRIVHLGFGAFHRAHQGIFANRLLNQGIEQDWGFCEVNLFGSEDLIECLRQQNHLYSVLEKGAVSNEVIVVGAVKESLHASLNGMAAIIEKMAEPQVAIVSLTITEKGYCTLPGGQGLDLTNPLIENDMLNPQQPHSAIGLLIEALYRRQQRGLSPFTILSCDNIPENGKVVKQAVLGLAARSRPGLVDWIERQVSFPNTMVDRIVPALTAETAREIETLLTVADPCAIVCEPFIQWVVEDNFVAGRPQWQKVGVELVNDVVPYEQMKLRMLNGSHSFLAYLGYLAGYQHINDCMADPAFRQATRQLMLQEQAVTLTIQNVDLTDYADRLIERFSNPALKHRTWQIAMDGSQKLPQRILDGIEWHLANGSEFPLLALAVAGWMRYISGRDDQGNPIDIRDPLLSQLTHICQNSSDGAPRVLALLAFDILFPTRLSSEEKFRRAVEAAYLQLMHNGAKATVEALCNLS